MTNDLEEILSAYPIQSTIKEIVPFGNGHINKSFRVITTEKSSPDYFLQEINHHVFRDVDGMMQNIWLVTKYLTDKYEAEEQGSSEDRVLKLVKTTTGSFYYQSGSSYWRLFNFMQNLASYDVPTSTSQVYEGAKAFGGFIRDLDGFDAASLTETIPFFHHMPNRLKIFGGVLKQMDRTLSEEETFEVNFIHEVSAEMCQLQELLDANKLPLRVTHNDTKFNNVLLDTNDHAKCVIDLDTVMPGIIHFDFGDGVRTGTTKMDEDEKDLQLVDVDLELFDAFCHGYLEALREVLSPIEINLLSHSAAMMSFIMGLRFLTDYLDGNKYYKISYEDQNLVRARCQLQLCRQMMKRGKELDIIVNKYV